MTIAHDRLLAAPKILLHDHLDGGLRPRTIVELASEVGHQLPTTDPDELGVWFAAAADSGSLERYLETFEHTVAVMQTREGLRRVAKEAVLDLAADGVVYAEQRYAPHQHLAGGLSLQDVVESVQEGFDLGVTEAQEAGHSIRIGTLLTALRQTDVSVEVADLVIGSRDIGVVGMDIAGPEAGFPPQQHLAGIQRVHEANMPVTIHAGEAAGPLSMWEAVHLCAANRLGHGARLIDDVQLLDHADSDEPIAELSPFAQWVRDRQITLELCPTSNLQTGAAASIADHPITTLKALDFAVTVNTDNRLMSATSMTREMSLLVAEAGWTMDDLRDVTINAALAAFLHYEDRVRLIEDFVLPGYDELIDDSDDE